MRDRNVRDPRAVNLTTVFGGSGWMLVPLYATVSQMNSFNFGSRKEKKTSHR